MRLSDIQDEMVLSRIYRDEGLVRDIQFHLQRLGLLADDPEGVWDDKTSLAWMRFSGLLPLDQRTATLLREVDRIATTASPHVISEIFAGSTPPKVKNLIPQMVEALGGDEAIVPDRSLLIAFLGVAAAKPNYLEGFRQYEFSENEKNPFKSLFNGFYDRGLDCLARRGRWLELWYAAYGKFEDPLLYSVTTRRAIHLLPAHVQTF